MTKREEPNEAAMQTIEGEGAPVHASGLLSLQQAHSPIHCRTVQQHDYFETRCVASCRSITLVQNARCFGK